MDFPEILAVCLASLSPLVFTARSYKAYITSTGILGFRVWPGAGIIYSQGIPPDFYLPFMNVGPSIPLAAAWPPCSSLPTHWDEYGFFNSSVVELSHSSIFWQFWVVYFCCAVSCDPGGFSRR